MRAASTCASSLAFESSSLACASNAFSSSIIPCSRNEEAAPGFARRGLVKSMLGEAYAAARLAMAANACGSLTAMSASTLRSSTMPAFFKPATSFE